jgi:flagellar biogenesis protein FliO
LLVLIYLMSGTIAIVLAIGWALKRFGSTDGHAKPAKVRMVIVKRPWPRR